MSNLPRSHTRATCWYSSGRAQSYPAAAVRGCRHIARLWYVGPWQRNCARWMWGFVTPAAPSFVLFPTSVLAAAPAEQLYLRSADWATHWECSRPAGTVHLTENHAWSILGRVARRARLHVNAGPGSET